MNELDKWAAEQCGVQFSELWKKYLMLDPKNAALSMTWTLSDARCMEVFREKFKLKTVYFNFPDIWKTSNNESVQTEGVEGFGKTIKEAELACAHAIMTTQQMR